MVNVLFDTDILLSWFSDKVAKAAFSYNHSHLNQEALLLAVVVERLQTMYLITLSEYCHDQLQFLYRLSEPYINAKDLEWIDNHLHKTFHDLSHTAFIGKTLSYVDYVSDDLILVFE